MNGLKMKKKFGAVQMSVTIATESSHLCCEGIIAGSKLSKRGFD